MATAEIIILVLALIGFIISFYIWRNKNKNKKLVCIVGKYCNEVVKSKYSKNFGIKNEVAGIFYYIFIFITSLLTTSIQNIILFNNIIIIFGGIAALFSVYLIFVQYFILKKFCEYCLATSLINIIIFLLILF